MYTYIHMNKYIDIYIYIVSLPNIFSSNSLIMRTKLIFLCALIVKKKKKIQLKLAMVFHSFQAFFAHYSFTNC